MTFNPRGVFFWLALSCSAGFYAFDHTKGAYAFGAVALAIWVLG